MAQRQLSNTTKALTRALQRLSTGNRISSAADDASGLARASMLEASVRGLSRATQNINESVGMLQTAEGALAAQTNIVHRMRELAVQAANGTLSSTDRSNLDVELQQLYNEFDRISTTTNFNGTNLLDGSFSTRTLQVGVTKDQTIDFGLSSSRSSSMITPDYVVSGTGAFSESSLSWTNNISRSVLGDFNGDGNQDVASIELVSDTYSIAYGNGDGTFQTRVTASTNANVAEIWAADMDHDGKDDVLVGGSGGTTVFYSSGGSTALAQTSSFVGVADINGDGYQDVIDGQGNYNLNQQNQTFGADVSTFGALVSIKAGDIDGDGITDVITRANSTTVKVWKGTGSGTFTQIQTISYTSALSLELSDINEDGRLDIVTAGTSGVNIALNNGSGTFSINSTISAGTNNRASVADINNDDHQDLIVTDLAGTTISTFLGQGNGSFGARVQTTTTSGQTTAPALGDFNNDGVVDFLVPHGTNNTISVWKGVSVTTAYPLSVSTQERAQNALDTLSDTLENLNSQRATIGAYLSRLEFAVQNNMMASENLSDAKSRLAETDYAEETAEMVRLQILQNAQVSVLGQSNLQFQMALQLLRF